MKKTGSPAAVKMLTSPRVSAIFGLNGEVEDLTSMASDISTQVGTWKIIAIPGGRDQGPGHYQWRKTRELALKVYHSTRNNGWRGFKSGSRRI